MKLNLIKKIIFFAAFVFSVAGATRASETSGTMANGGNNGYGWSDRAGWVNFGCANCDISITDSGIAGYAWSPNYGWINMKPTNGGVFVATNGALSGYAWGSSLGWINFSGASINSSGKFVGQASGANIGALTFDCANCSVTTDFRPQNFRTVASVPTTAVSAGGAIPGIIAIAPPLAITALNVPLTIAPTQSGTLSQNLSGERRVDLNVQRDSFSDAMTFAVDEQTVSVAGASQARVVDGAIFDIKAFNATNGERVRSFLRPIRITLTVPESLEGRADIGAYFFDENKNEWIIIPDAAFVGNKATFLVDHLTLFGVFNSSFADESGIMKLPETIPSFFEAPPVTVTPSPGGEGVISTPLSGREGIIPPPSGTEVAIGEGDILPTQLFDINLEIESATIPKIKDLVARLIFTSFGRMSTPVDLTFDIVNDKGETVYTKEDEITVQTQAVLTEQFADIETLFESGKYTLVVTTLYNKNVRDEFKQNFEIVGAEEIKTPLWKSAWFWILSTIAISIVFVAVIRKMNKEKNNKRRFK